MKDGQLRCASTAARPKRPLVECLLYGFVDMGYLKQRDPLKSASQMIAGGVDIIQLRDKRADKAATLELAKLLKALTASAGIWLIVNDFPDIAAEAGADGVHLGQEDLQTTTITVARNTLANQGIVGVSTHSLAQALAAEQNGADYIAVGPIFPTATKPTVKPVGLELLEAVVTRVHCPVFAIGGINRRNLSEVLQTGARAVAVVSDILCAGDIEQATRELKNALTASLPHTPS